MNEHVSRSRLMAHTKKQIVVYKHSGPRSTN